MTAAATPVAAAPSTVTAAAPATAKPATPVVAAAAPAPAGAPKVALRPGGPATVAKPVQAAVPAATAVKPVVKAMPVAAAAPGGGPVPAEAQAEDATSNRTMPIIMPTDEAASNRTMAIELPPEPAAPVVIKAVEEAPAPDAIAALSKKKTSRIPLGAATTVPADGAAKISPPKKDTSKIPLAAAVAAPAGSAAAAPVTIKLVKPKVPTIVGGAPVPGVAGGADEKRKTARIALEAALAMPGVDKASAEPLAAAGGEGPKTIRLKRPGEGPAPKPMEAAKSTAPMPAAAVAPEKETPTAASVTKTARLEESALEPETEDSSATRRKTIKVKRPTGKGGAVEGEEGGVAVDHSKMPARLREPGRAVAGRGGEKAPHWFFGVAAIFTLFITMAIIWMFCAQTIGPGTVQLFGPETKYYSGGPDLPWPNKIMLNYPTP
jgi:hypothetical protein